MTLTELLSMELDQVVDTDYGKIHRVPGGWNYIYEIWREGEDEMDYGMRYRKIVSRVVQFVPEPPKSDMQGNALKPVFERGTIDQLKSTLHGEPQSPGPVEDTEE